MPVLRRRIFRFCASLGVVLILASLTGGCGRRGRLLPPPDPDNPFALPAKPVLSPTAADAAGQGAKPAGTAAVGTTTAAAAPNGGLTKAGLHRKLANPPIVAPKQPFILDPLL